MTDWNLATEEGLRQACVEVEKQIHPNRLARVTKFLAEVAAVPPHERASEDFQKRIWSSNLVAGMPGGTFEWLPKAALGNQKHRRWFADLTNAQLPTDWEERGKALADVFWETVNRFILSTGRPRRRTLSTLAALFPEHLTGAVNEEWLKELQWRLGWSELRASGLTGTERECRDQLLYSYWIRHRLDEVLGKPQTMEGHARRLLLSGKLAELVSGEWGTAGEATEPESEHHRAEDQPAESKNRQTNVWLFRAGQDGEDEDAWLDRGLAFLGFQEVGDLMGCGSNEDVRERVVPAYPDSKAGVITTFTTQLRQFAVDPGRGDLVVMPRKGQPRVAIGRIAGDYAYADVDGTPRHRRPVVWEQRDVPRARLGADLVKKLGFAGTVCWLGGQEQADKIEALLSDEPENRLVPLPASRRRKGIPSVPGGFAGMLALLDHVRDHPSLEDNLDYLRAEYPNLQERTHKIQFGVVRTGFRCISVSGDRVELTELGQRLAESRDPDVLRDDLLTKVLCPDHVVVELAGGQKRQADLVALLQHANPNWTSTFGPLIQLGWLRQLDVLRKQDDETFALTERGLRWRAVIHWTPEGLPRDEPAPVVDPVEVSVPPLEAIVERVQAAARKRDLAFSGELIESLHLGLWANERRHFAILAGLSGSGKTQLAMEYGRALTGADDESSVRLCAVSAAPGWHDPSPLLGYVNPLDGTYAGTDFQRFLLNAAGNPKEVHVCVLDEMNLSHPEQYLAPLLSAMEREGGMVEFHDSDEMALGVPQRIPYPRNLVLIGTVNMDETTMGLSDKVLDRAFTREFWDIAVDDWPGWEACTLADHELERVRKLLNALTAALRAARLHFGWRVIAEFVAFLERRAADSAEVAFERALDQITYAKVLPKLRGDDSQRYRTALEACRKVLDDEDLSESAQKVEELMQDLDETGSFRFWR